VQRITEIPKLPPRPTDAHKGTAGLVLVVAGSRGMAGSAALVGNAALRSGAGLVRIATPDAALDTVAVLAPCCTTVPLPDDGARISREAAQQIVGLVEGWHVLAMGPGLGQSDGVTACVLSVLAHVAKPIVLDADGLNALGKNAAAVLRGARAPVILTPHPGEAARLLGVTTKEIQADREGAAARLAALGAGAGPRALEEVGGAIDAPSPPRKRRGMNEPVAAPSPGVVAILKGAGTVVCDGQRIYVNTTGNPGLATAGAGDVLTGHLAALVAAGLSPFDAAVLAVWTHGRAGDMAAERAGILGLTAVDILDCLPDALRA
jgi:NAD(P)H-hydrate epimerase